jgi:hypothetical protein
MKFPANNFQPEVNPDTSIVFFGELWDIGVRVVKWYERGGYDGYSKKKVITKDEDRRTGKMIKKIIKGKRYGSRWGGRKVTAVKQFMVHHTGGYLPGVCFNTLHNERRLSVQFIEADNGTIYQTMDAKEIAWHGSKQNRCSIGVECCLYPKAWSNPEAYRPQKCERLGLEPHTIGHHRTQGKKRKVFEMPECQVTNLAFLIAGTWFARDCKKHGGPVTPPQFPVVGSRVKIDTGFSKEHRTHEGIVLHANTAPKKWDATGVDLDALELKVSKIYRAMEKGIQ